MRGPPPAPGELQARLWRYVRDPAFASVPFRDAVFRASEHFEISPYEVFDLLGDADW